MTSRHTRSMSVVVVDNSDGAPFAPPSIHGIRSSNGNYYGNSSGGTAGGGGRDEAVVTVENEGTTAAAAAKPDHDDDVQLPSSPPPPPPPPSPLNLYAIRTPTPTPTPTLRRHCKLCENVDPDCCNCCFCLALYPPPSPPLQLSSYAHDAARLRYIRDADHQSVAMELRRSGRRGPQVRYNRFGPSAGQRTADSVPEIEVHMVKVVAEYDARNSAAGHANRDAGQRHGAAAAAAAAATDDDDDDDDEQKDNGCGTKTMNFCMQCLGCTVM